MSGIFVTGTDTGAGKTRVAAGILTACRGQGLRTAAMKPVASGCYQTPDGLRNEDALILQRHATVQAPYPLVNPCALAAATAPSLAAKMAGTAIDLEGIEAAFLALSAQADYTVVEGIGGWMVPLGRRVTVADLAQRLGLPVVLVVTIRLGCLNQALLSVAALRRSTLPLAGWIANQTHAGDAGAQEMIKELDEWLGLPMVGSVPYLESSDAESIAGCLDMGLLGASGLEGRP